jgi:hypothetical protein
MPANATDYIVYKLNGDPYVPILSKSEAVNASGVIFERTVTSTMGTNTALINVRVNYEYDRVDDEFKFSVNLSTTKGN